MSQPDLAATTRAKYRQTLSVVEDELGTARVTGAAIGGVLAQRWHHSSPGDANRHVAIVRSFTRDCRRTGVLGIDLAARDPRSSCDRVRAHLRSSPMPCRARLTGSSPAR
ncbi:MAG: hypothetical protein H0W96_11725 [Solirubrobacterales bacterium]|nr:hypothetical protein [Solirubrobacterales bacterium]